MSVESNWTPEKYARAKQMWATGSFVTEIASEVQIKTNTVISMMGRHRDDFPARDRPTTLDKWRDKMDDLHSRIKSLTLQGVSAEWMSKTLDVNAKSIRRLQRVIFGMGSRALAIQPTYRRLQAKKPAKPKSDQVDAYNQQVSKKLLEWVAPPNPDGWAPRAADDLPSGRCLMPLWGLDKPAPGAGLFCAAPVYRDRDGYPHGSWCAFHRAQVYTPSYLRARAAAAAVSGEISL